MPYFVDVSEFGLPPDVDAVGWCVILPITFAAAGAQQPGGQLQAHWHRLAAIVHLETEVEINEAFRTRTDAALAAPGGGVLRIVHAGDAAPVLTISKLTLVSANASQCTAASETMWLFRGIGVGTGLQWQPPAQPFPDWGRHRNNRFGWKGRIGSTQSRLSCAHLEWAGAGFYQSASFVGPAGPQGTGALANTVLACLEPYRPANPLQPVVGHVCGELDFIDDSRNGRNVTLLGETSAGRQQVQNAAAALWFCQGTLAEQSIDVHRRLCEQVHGAQISIVHATNRGRICDTPLLERPARPLPSDAVFEGLSLWNLQDRGVNDNPVLL